MSENCYWWGCAFIIICSLSGSAGRLILLYRWIYSMANWACLNITSDDFIVCFIWLFALRLKMLDRQGGHWKQSYEWYCMRFWSIYYHGVWIFYVYVCYLLAMSVCSLSCKPCVTWLCWMYSMVDRFLVIHFTDDCASAEFLSWCIRGYITALTPRHMSCYILRNGFYVSVNVFLLFECRRQVRHCLKQAVLRR